MIGEGLGRGDVAFDDVLDAGHDVRAVWAASGVSATNGAEASTAKNTAPVNRTARSTSERVSPLTATLLPDVR